jgi:quercetin dioxygenase-like cupin family protein
MAINHDATQPAPASAGVFDPKAFQRFSAEQATVVRVHADGDLSLVVWNLEPGQENPLHVHPENAHAIIVLQGEGRYLQDEREVPIKAGDCIAVPRALAHGIRNTGAGRLSYLAVTTTGEGGYVRNLLGGQGPGAGPERT